MGVLNVEFGVCVCRCPKADTYIFAYISIHVECELFCYISFHCLTG